MEVPQAKSPVSNPSTIIFVVLLVLSFILLAIGIVLNSSKIQGISTLLLGISFAFGIVTSPPHPRLLEGPGKMYKDYWGIIGIGLATTMIVLSLLIILGYIG